MRQTTNLWYMPVIAIFGLTALSGVAAADCEIKLGVIGPMSGAAAAWGATPRGGAELGAAEANEAGGLQVGVEKCKVTVEVVDSKYTPEGAASAANHMVSRGIKFIIGPVVTPELIAIKPIAARNGLLLMASTYARDVIGPQWPLVFHATPGPSAWSEEVVRFAKTKFNFKKVLIIVPNDQGGTDVAAGAAPGYKKNGVEVIEEYFNRGITNFGPLVTRIMAAKPDAVDSGGSSPGEAGAIVKQLRLAGFEGPIGRVGGPGASEIARIAGGYDVIKNAYWYEGVYNDEKILAMNANYKRLLKADPPESSLFPLFAAGTRMVLKAISKAGTATDVNKVAEALRSLPPEDPNFGKGYWVGKEFFGVNQELSFPFGIGLVADGKLQPMVRHEAAAGK